MTAWIDRLPISAKLERLSTLAHLLALLHLSATGGKALMTTQLYYDIQSLVKQAYLLTTHCVHFAQRCADGQPVPVYLELVGSDSLEELYAAFRRVIADFSMRQLGTYVVQSACDVVRIQEQHVEWRPSNGRRDINPNLIRMQMGQKVSDHQSLGDLHPDCFVTDSDTLLCQTSWDSGRRVFERIAKEARKKWAHLSC